MVYSLDTNILIRFFVVDSEFNKILALLNNDKNTIHISDLVISEMVYVLEKVYKVTRPTLCEFLDYLIAKENVNLNRAWLAEVRKIYEIEKKLSFVDIAALVYARLNGALPLLTMDKQLQKFGGRDVRGL